jgi:hypothetical protein
LNIKVLKNKAKTNQKTKYKNPKIIVNEYKITNDPMNPGWYSFTLPEATSMMPGISRMITNNPTPTKKYKMSRSQKRSS